MSIPISILSNHIIVDSICDGLSLQDIHACRQVSKHWAALFKPYLWSAIKLNFSDTYEHINIIRNKKHRIRSLTVASEHIDEVSRLGLTTLRELTLYDEFFEFTPEDDHPFNIKAVLSLIGNNRNLSSLSIDLNACHYLSGQLSPSLMLAIGRHPSLTRLTWYVPDGHGNDDFAERLLRVCHNSIRELFVYYKCVARPYFDMNHYERFTYDRFSSVCHRFGEFIGRDIPPDYKELQHQWPLDVPLDLLEPFLLRKICLPNLFDLCIPALLRNCPEMEDADVYLLTETPETRAETVDTLIRCPRLRGIGLWTTWDRSSLVADLRRFRHLQRVRIPVFDQHIASLLAASNLRTLTVLYLDLASFPPPEVMIACLETFPNLKEIDVLSVKIRLWDMEELAYSPRRIQSTIEDLDSLDTVAQDWESQGDRRWMGTICSWWYEWTSALNFMQAVLRVYQQRNQQSELRSIQMQFMYPIKSFLPRDIALEYVNVAGPWSRTRSALTMSDVRGMVAERKRFVYQNACSPAEFDQFLYDLFHDYFRQFCKLDWELDLDVAVAKSRHRHRGLWGVRKQGRQRQPKK